MSEFLGSDENRISVEILVPGDETVSVGRLCQYLNRTSPRAVLRVTRKTSKASVVSSIESVSTSTGDGTTPSEQAYLSRARGFWKVRHPKLPNPKYLAKGSLKERR